MNRDRFLNQVDEVMKRSIENSTRSIFDEYIKQNAANRASVGITAKIVRKMHSETCEWCRSLAGVYIYGQEPHEVYQRHDNCDCTVEYYCEKGRQNVWESNNSWLEENEYKKKERITVIISKGKTVDDYNKKLKRINIDKLYENELTNDKIKLEKDIKLSTNNLFNSHDPNDMYNRAKKVIPLDGYDDVFIHGDEFGFAVIDANGKQISYTIREIAEILNKYGKFENDSIRLCSCRTGANSGAAAQGLANLTVKNVLAPTKDLWIKQEDDKGICEKEIKHMVNGNCLFQRGDLYEVNTTL